LLISIKSRLEIAYIKGLISEMDVKTIMRVITEIGKRMDEIPDRIIMVNSDLSKENILMTPWCRHSKGKWNKGS
jgi:hypothetical protein